MDINEIVYRYGSNYFVLIICTWTFFFSPSTYWPFSVFLFTGCLFTSLLIYFSWIICLFVSDLWEFFISNINLLSAICIINIFSQSFTFVVGFITQKFFNFGLFGQILKINSFLYFMSYHKISITTLDWL